MKIVVMFGFVINDKKILKVMIEVGVNVFRINFFYVDYNDVKKWIKMICELGEELGISIVILVDL